MGRYGLKGGASNNSSFDWSKLNSLPSLSNNQIGICIVLNNEIKERITINVSSKTTASELINTGINKTVQGVQLGKLVNAYNDYMSCEMSYNSTLSPTGAFLLDSTMSGFPSSKTDEIRKGKYYVLDITSFYNNYVN